MSISINGNGITSANIADGAITNADIADVAASKLTGALPAISGAALTNLPGGGKVLQVVSSSKETTTAVSSTSFVTSGLSVSITPVSTSSKILVLITGTVQITATNNAPYGTIYRGSTNLSTASGGGFFHRYPTLGTGVIAINYLDSPSTTSATTYALYAKQVNGGSANWFNGGKGAITLMEIGA